MAALPNLGALALGAPGRDRLRASAPTGAPLGPIDLAREFPDQFAKILDLVANGDAPDACRMATVFLLMISRDAHAKQLSNAELWRALVRAVFGYAGGQYVIDFYYRPRSEQTHPWALGLTENNGGPLEQRRPPGQIVFEMLCLAVRDYAQRPKPMDLTFVPPEHFRIGPLVLAMMAPSEGDERTTFLPDIVTSVLVKLDARAALLQDGDFAVKILRMVRLATGGGYRRREMLKAEMLTLIALFFPVPIAFHLPLLRFLAEDGCPILFADVDEADRYLLPGGDRPSYLQVYDRDALDGGILTEMGINFVGDEDCVVNSLKSPTDAKVLMLLRESSPLWTNRRVLEAAVSGRGQWRYGSVLGLNRLGERLAALAGNGSQPAQMYLNDPEFVGQLLVLRGNEIRGGPGGPGDYPTWLPPAMATDARFWIDRVFRGVLVEVDNLSFLDIVTWGELLTADPAARAATNNVASNTAFWRQAIEALDAVLLPRDRIIFARRLFDQFEDVGMGDVFRADEDFLLFVARRVPTFVGSVVSYHYHLKPTTELLKLIDIHFDQWQDEMNFGFTLGAYLFEYPTFVKALAAKIVRFTNGRIMKSRREMHANFVNSLVPNLGEHTGDLERRNMLHRAIQAALTEATSVAQWKALASSDSDDDEPLAQRGARNAAGGSSDEDMPLSERHKPSGPRFDSSDEEML